MQTKTVIVKSAEETQAVAWELVKSLREGALLCLYGDLGAGKTTFLQGLAKGLGITQRIISPTFIIVRKYKITNYELRIKNFYHVDLYRTKTIDDLKSIGLEEILEDKNAIVAIEWAEKLGNLLPEKRIDLKFEYINENSRKIIIQKYE